MEKRYLSQSGQSLLRPLILTGREDSLRIYRGIKNQNPKARNPTFQKNGKFKNHFKQKDLKTALKMHYIQDFSKNYQQPPSSKF